MLHFILLTIICACSFEQVKSYKNHDLHGWNFNPFGKQPSELIQDNKEILDQFHIYKCSKAIKNKFLVVPELLRVPQSPDIIRNFGNHSIYNFTLVTRNKLPFNGFIQTRDVDIQVPKPRASNSSKLMVIYVNKPNYFTSSGFAKLNKSFIHPENYCISRIAAETISIRIFPVLLPRFTFGKPPEAESVMQKQIPFSSSFLPKCCPVGTVVTLNLSNSKVPGGCGFVDRTQEFKPLIWKSKGMNLDTQLNFAYRPVSNKMCQMKTFTISSSNVKHQDDLTIKKRIRILNTGDILTRISGNHKWQQEQTTDFCLDGFWDVGTFSVFLRNQSSEMIIVSCAKNSTSSLTFSLLYFGSYGISAITFFIILLVYIVLILEKTQNIHGLTIFGFVFCAFFKSMCVVLTHALSIWHQNSIKSSGCIILGIFGHFFYIAFFSWMMVLNFDLYSTIRSMEPISERSKKRKRFLLYCAFGFGIPIIVVISSLIIEASFGFFDDSVIRPQYGRTRCFIDKSAVFQHATITNTVLVITNLILALLTLKTLVDFKRTVRILNNSSKSAFPSKSSALLFGKLFILMGLSWVFDILSEFDSNGQTENINWYWIIFDVYNPLQALALFYIFVWKPEVKKQLSIIYRRLFKGNTRVQQQSTSRFASRINPVFTKNTSISA